MKNETIQSIPLAQLIPHPENPRGPVAADAPDVLTLAAEIEQAGNLYHALNVVPGAEPNQYCVVVGHRRLAALQRLGWASAPCLIRDWDAEEQYRVMLAENLQREDLTPLQEARGFVRLRGQEGTYSTVARKLGTTAAYIQSRVIILRLAETVQALFDSTEMPTVAAQELVKVTNPDQQERLALLVLNRQMTVTQLKQRVKRLEEPAPAEEPGAPAARAKPQRAEQTATAGKAAAPPEGYARQDALDDLGRLKTQSLTFEELAAAMAGVCVPCGMGTHRQICAACALPQFIGRLVNAHA